MAHRIIGKPIGRVDGIKKVSGEARYSGDVSVPGLVWGKALRSPLPHARIVRIDTSRARAAPDVLEEATTLIDVEYEDLPAMIDPEAAIAPGAPLVHENPGAYEGAPAE